MSSKENPPHIQAQASRAAQESQDSDADVRAWMERLGQDPDKLTDAWRYAHAASLRNLQTAAFDRADDGTLVPKSEK